MHDLAISRNYAEALLALARKANAAEEWAGLINALAQAIEQDLTLQRFLAAPQVSGADKSKVLGKALAGRAPALFIRFVQKLVTNRRQTMIPSIATEYGNLLDEAEGRIHARVTVARELTEADQKAIADSLSRSLNKIVVPHVAVNPAILGGIVVRFGDTVMDGSVRKRLASLRGKMMAR
jgi:F-type H+-transporting ATPase subunit delta